MILWVNLIGQDTAGHGEKIVIKPRYQESRPNITPSFTMNEGGQHRGTEKLLISISAQAGRQASAANTALLLTKEFGIFHKLLRSPPDVLGICQSFPVSLLQPQRGHIKPGGKTPFLTLETPQKCFKRRRLCWAPAFSYKWKVLLLLINQKLQLPQKARSQGQKYSGHWMTEFS